MTVHDPHGSPADDAEVRRDELDRRAAAELETFGYRQQLQRTMGAFSSFALSFSLISITTGIFANFGHGIRQAGPAVIWSWSLAVVGQLLVALVIADLATRIPLSGYGYQWASRLVSPHYGFFVGWLLTLQWLTGFPGICKTLADYLHGFVHPGCTVTGHSLGLVVVIISAIAIIHLWGIRLAALVNDVGVIAEIVGAAVVTLALLLLYGFSRPDGFSFLLDSTNYATGQPADAKAFAFSLLLGAWCLTGFEAAADLAEETHQPRDVVPKAIIMSELSSGIGGFLMLAAFILAIGDLRSVQAIGDAPLLTIIQQRLGTWITPAVMLVLFASIFACGVASLAATTRLLFALARDNMLPGSSVLKQVHAVHQTPRNVILLVWVVIVLLVLGLSYFEQLNAITSISAVTGYLGYAGIVVSALFAPARSGVSGGFGLGRWRVPVAIAALAWTLGVVVALLMPNTGDAQTVSTATTARVTAGGIGLGLLLYVGYGWRRIRNGTAGPPRSAN
ncbi:MAG: amino acid permease [Planctomycetaceae bacterium]|nr:amino acid permease [Planctomycetaceae bacterium]